MSEMNKEAFIPTKGLLAYKLHSFASIINKNDKVTDLMLILIFPVYYCDTYDLQLSVGADK